jgi:putative YphP/YqiW family bacilliredoxin
LLLLKGPINDLESEENQTNFVLYCYKAMPYPEMLVAPMRTELVNAGFKELKDAAEVDQHIPDSKGTALVVINSVCGCAAGAARPGVLRSLTSEHVPDKLYTVFAGQDMEATEKTREYLLPYPPSSPAVALLKDGKLVYFMQRMNIEGHSAEQVAEQLKTAYSEFCTSEVTQ